MLCKL